MPHMVLAGRKAKIVWRHIAQERGFNHSSQSATAPGKRRLRLLCFGTDLAAAMQVILPLSSGVAGWWIEAVASIRTKIESVTCSSCFPVDRNICQVELQRVSLSSLVTSHLSPLSATRSWFPQCHKLARKRFPTFILFSVSNIHGYNP